jgi:hypothetical protein
MRFSLRNHFTAMPIKLDELIMWVKATVQSLRERLGVSLCCLSA